MLNPEKNFAWWTSLQDEREKRSFGKGKSYQFMMRTRQPAGVVSNALYLKMDDLANEVPCGP